MMEDHRAAEANTDDLEAVMALGVFNQLCASSAFTAEACEVTQSGLLYALWVFLTHRLIRDGLEGKDLCENILYTERFLHGQANPS